MDFSVKIEGLDRIDRATGEMRDAVAKELEAALYICAKKVEEDAKKSILSGQKSGRTYRKSAIRRKRKNEGTIIGSQITFVDGKAQKSGIMRRAALVGYTFHRASAPGESPASDTGRLANSINARMVKKGLEAIVKAGSGAVKYAAWLEFGTSGVVGHKISFDGGKVSETGEITRGAAARPFLFPALEKNKLWIRDRLNKAVRDAAMKSLKK